MGFKSTVKALRNDCRIAALLALLSAHWGIFFCATVGGAGLHYYWQMRYLVEGRLFYRPWWVTPPGTAILSVPFYLISLPFTDYIHYRDREYLLLQGDIFIHSFMYGVGLAFYSVLTLILIYDMARRISSRNAAFTATIAAFFGSPFGFYSNGMYHPEVAVETFLVTSAIFFWSRGEESSRHRDDLLCGLALGLAAITKYSNTILIPLFLIPSLVSRNVKRLLVLILSITLPILLVYSLYMFPAQSQFGIFPGSRYGSWVGGPLYVLYILFAYENRGFLVFSPVFLLSFYGFFLLFKEKRRYSLLLLGVFLVMVLFYGSMEVVATNRSPYFGFRYLTVTVPALSVLLSRAVDEFYEKKWTIPLLFTVLAVAFSYLILVQHLLGLRLPPSIHLFRDYLSFWTGEGALQKFLWKIILSPNSNLRLINSTIGAYLYLTGYLISIVFSLRRFVFSPEDTVFSS